MSIYSPEELAVLAELERKIEDAKYWVRYWKLSNAWDMVAQWNRTLLDLLHEYNAALDKKPSPLQSS